MTAAERRQELASALTHSLVLRAGWGWSLFGAAWGLAVAGIVFKLLFIECFHYLSTATYIGMGWMALVVAGPMIRLMEPVTLAWILAGGIIYSAGTWFYHRDGIPYSHAIWHLFVIGGSVCHGIAVATQL